MPRGKYTYCLAQSQSVKESRALLGFIQMLADGRYFFSLTRLGHALRGTLYRAVKGNYDQMDVYDITKHNMRPPLPIHDGYGKDTPQRLNLV